jgi:hypothetical protein
MTIRLKRYMVYCGQGYLNSYWTRRQAQWGALEYALALRDDDPKMPYWVVKGKLEEEAALREVMIWHRKEQSHDNDDGV